jgi:hypothetical protein
MVHSRPGDLPGNQELPLYESYARWCVRSWRRTHADDPRELAKVVLLSRSIEFPDPGNDPSRFQPPTETVIGTFGPDGKLRDGPDSE